MNPKTRLLHAVAALSLSCLPAGVQAQRVAKELKPVKLKRWGVPTAQYSGIAPLGNDLYAVVSDKEPQDGFYPFRICLEPGNGKVASVERMGFRGTPAAQLSPGGYSLRDCEGVAYSPATAAVWVSGEGDQRIASYGLDGRATGQTLAVPPLFSIDRIQPNYGFEALACDTVRHIFWTTTENALLADVAAGDALPVARPLLRLLRVEADGRSTVYVYPMEPRRTAKRGRMYAHGVVALVVLPDGRLLVMERELNVPKHYVGMRCHCRLFVVDPLRATPLSSPDAPLAGSEALWLTKRELWHTTTRLNLTRRNLANYEGMCLARPLPDGRWPLLLINDSQAGAGRGPVRLKDYLKVLLLDGLSE